MSETWKQWEGRTVAGRFPLQSYLGGSDHSAVFLTLRQSAAGDSEKAAIKLIAVPADAEKQLLRWKLAGELNHPNVIRIFEAGRCEVDGTDLLYVVEEYAEENLSQILPERALTAEEALTMLPPVLKALQFVHDKGFAHGHIHPANIFAIGDQVKLSSDALEVPGETSRRAESTSAYDPPEAATSTAAASTAADVWQLGMTLVEVLTQRLPVWDRAQTSAPKVPPTIPATVPEPFREVAGRCLQMDAAKRCTIAEITAKINDRLESAKVEPAPATAPT
ncbi:MAG: protein kinase, partial [Terriglobales bacterium]